MIKWLARALGVHRYLSHGRNGFGYLCLVMMIAIIMAAKKAVEKVAKKAIEKAAEKDVVTVVRMTFGYKGGVNVGWRHKRLALHYTMCFVAPVKELSSSCHSLPLLFIVGSG